MGNWSYFTMLTGVITPFLRWYTGPHRPKSQKIGGLRDAWATTLVVWHSGTKHLQGVAKVKGDMLMAGDFSGKLTS